LSGEKKTNLRLSDFMGVIPAITGKVELVYEGEQEGAAVVASYLIGDAIKSLFPKYFPEIQKLEREDEQTPYTELLEYIFNESGFHLEDSCSDKEYKKTLDNIKPLTALLNKYQKDISKEDKHFWMEFILWGLVEHDKLSKERVNESYEFKDVFAKYISRF